MTPSEWIKMRQQDQLLQSLIKLRNDAIARVGFEQLAVVYGQSIIRLCNMKG